MQQGVQESPSTDLLEIETSRSYKRYFTMLRCLAELFMVFLFIFTSYANLQKGALKVQFQPPPVPFLDDNSTIDDYYGGDITSPFTSVLRSDVSLVMYYAPWDFDSQLTRKAFDQLALKYQDQVYFSAVNCWVQSGDCKQIFSKLRSFPVILGYVGGNNGIQFRGPLQFKFLDRFVQQLIRPYERIESTNDLFRMLAKSTGVVTGYFNFSDSQPVGFRSFYHSSLKYLEYDIHHSTKFAVITNPKAARDLGIPNLSLPTLPYDIRLHLWNETLIYPRNATGIDVNRFLQWIYYRSHCPVQWIWPSGRKSQVIQHYLSDQQRPSFILFTPKTECSEHYLAVKEVALEYHNCAISSRISRLISEIQVARHAIEQERVSLNQCSIGENEGCSSDLRNVTDPCTTTTVNDSSCSALNRSMPCRFHFDLNIRGLGCRTNRTLNFYLLDSEQYPHFTSKLGSSAKNYYVNANQAFIVDPGAESYYSLNEPLTVGSIRQLLVNFTSQSLSRFRRSTLQSNSCPESRLCIESATSDRFHTILDPAYDTIVYYHKNGCIFCDAGARAFLRLSQVFALTEPLPQNATLREIKFATINAEDNDLPWHFTVDKYPTVVFFPAERKMESRTFPYELELNVANLLNFTLSHLTLRQRILWFIHFCKEPACLQEAKRQIDAQSFKIDQNIRTLRYRLSLAKSRDVSAMEDLRIWFKERFFFKELQYSVVKTLSDLKQDDRVDLFTEGVKWVYQQ